MSIEQLKSYLGNSLSNKEATTIEQKEDLVEQLESDFEYWKNFEPGFWGKLFTCLGSSSVGFAGGYNLRRGRVKLF